MFPIFMPISMMTASRSMSCTASGAPLQVRNSILFPKVPQFGQAQCCISQPILRGDVIFIKDGKYVISNVYSKAYNGESSLFGATWADINLDGRMDMLYWKKERFIITDCQAWFHTLMATSCAGTGMHRSM